MFLSNTNPQIHAHAMIESASTIRIPFKNLVLAVKMRRYCLSSIIIPSFLINIIATILTTYRYYIIILLQKYELTDNFEEHKKKRDCSFLCAIFVKYALDFKDIDVYNGDKYEMKNF